MNRKKAVSILLASTLLSSSFSFTSFAFEDTEKHWANPYIDGLESEQIIRGYEDGEFKPEEYITREETAVIIDRAIEAREVILEEKVDKVLLSDIEGLYGEKSIENLVEKGVIEGYPDKTFRPENNITRQEFSAVVYRVLDEKAKGEIDKNFSDIENEWGADMIERLSELGVIDGYPDGSFKPNEPVTRAEVAKVVSVAINGKDASGKSLIKTEEDNKKVPDKDKETGDVQNKEEKPSSGGPAYNKKSSETSIQVKENNNVVKEVEEENSVIHVYAAKKTSEGYEKAKFQDIINEIKAADNSKQTYEIEGPSGLTDYVIKGNNLKVISENGMKEKIYSITVEPRKQEAPEGIGSEAASSDEASNGKITGVNGRMQYSDNPNSSEWTDVDEGKTEIDGLKPGTYYIRYAPDYDLQLGESDNVEIKVAVDESKQTEIKAKDSAKLLKSVDNESNKIVIYKSKLDDDDMMYKIVKVKDVIDEIEPKLQGVNQNYQILGISGGIKVSPHKEVSEGNVLEVQSSDTDNTREFSIEFESMTPPAPKAEMKAIIPKADYYKIIGVNSQMEYKIFPKDSQNSEDIKWKEIEEDVTEIENIGNASYENKCLIRYKENEKLKLNSGEIIEFYIPKMKII